MRLIDFEKAFDLISVKCIQWILELFGFGPSVRKRVSTFYTNIRAYILESERRQGDPLSPYLFILSVVLLGILIQNNPHNIGGIGYYRINKFVNDTQLYLDETFTSLDNFIDVN